MPLFSHAIVPRHKKRQILFDHGFLAPARAHVRLTAGVVTLTATATPGILAGENDRVTLTATAPAGASTDYYNLAFRYQHVLHHADVATFVLWAANEGLPIIAIDNVPGSVLIETFAIPERCVLLFGQEGPGLSDEAIAAADAVLEISQFGSTRSINASAAAAVAMHDWVLQHRFK